MAGGTSMSRTHLGQPVVAGLPDDRLGLDEAPDAFLQEEWIALGPLDHALRERRELDSRAEEGPEKQLRVLGREGIEPELAVVGPSQPREAGTPGDGCR